MPSFVSRFIAWHRAPGVFWFRIGGFGLHFRDTARVPLQFSEKNGYTRMWTIRKLDN